MSYCRNCGAEISEKAVICPKCGVPTEKLRSTSHNSNDSGNIGWGILGFILPIVGLILFIAWKDSKPEAAKAASIGALIKVIIITCIIIIYVVIAIVTSNNLNSSSHDCILRLFL